MGRWEVQMDGIRLSLLRTMHDEDGDNTILGMAETLPATTEEVTNILYQYEVREGMFVSARVLCDSCQATNGKGNR